MRTLFPNNTQSYYLKKASCKYQKQPSRGVPRERCCENAVKPSYSGHPFQRTPLYNGHLSQKRMK